ncbi:hypothetical protein PENTCL1PPCAC_2673, partial [Pristionchus entomophagus]
HQSALETPLRMRSFILLALVAAVSGNHVLNELRDRVISADAQKLTGQALVDYINSNQQFYKAKLNTRFAHLSESAKIKAINGVAPSIDELASQLDKEGRATHTVLADELPEFFDARAAWPACEAIGLIRDQSNCGSCWAMSTGEIISDRICVASGGSQHYNMSSDDIMSCCGLQCGNGCNGGNPLQAMKWYVSHGVVTGSNYEAHAGCMPYPFPSCEHHNNNEYYQPCDSEPDFKTPKCDKACQAGYPLTYAQDKHYGKSAYGVSRKVSDIQKEIFTNGPVSASFNVYEDFEQYTSGIYVHNSGKYLGGHAVKVIGWGTEGSTPYWLVANSWNTDWGENGLFRIIRGTNEVGFEAGIVAGLPKL